jgi:hypothetical protein
MVVAVFDLISMLFLFHENNDNDNRFNEGELNNESKDLAAVGTGEIELGRGGIEPPTHGFSVRCSTN